MNKAELRKRKIRLEEDLKKLNTMQLHGKINQDRYFEEATRIQKRLQIIDILLED